MHILVCFVLIHNSITTGHYMSLKGQILDYIEVNEMHTGAKNNILSCARECKDVENCTGLFYNETEQLCGLTFQNASSYVARELTGAGFKMTNHLHKSCGQWEKLLSIDMNGQTISGSYEELKKTVNNGAKLQIVVNRDNRTLSYEINSVLSNDNMVCALSKMHLTYSGKWTYSLMCTDGRVVMLTFKMNDTESESIYKLNDLISTDWFVLEDVCHRVMLNENSKPYITLNNKHMPSITVVQSNDIFVKVNHQTFVDEINDKVEVTSYGEVASTCDHGQFGFDKNLAWKSTKYHFCNSVEELICSINENKSCSFNESRMHQNMYIEGSWEKAYVRTLSGNETFGNFVNLRSKLLQGHNLQVYFNGKYREPDIIFVDDSDISALFSLYPITPSVSVQPYVVWSLVSTSGRYETIKIDYFTGKILNHSVDTYEVSWFIDKNIWTNVLNADSTSLEKLVNAVTAGFALRIKSKCLHSSERSTSPYCLYPAVSVYFDGQKQYASARANLIPHTILNVTGLFLTMNDPPLWMHFTTRSNNLLRKRLMLHRSQHFESDTSEIEQGTSWYASNGIHE